MRHSFLFTIWLIFDTCVCIVQHALCLTTAKSRMTDNPLIGLKCMLKKRIGNKDRQLLAININYVLNLKVIEFSSQNNLRWTIFGSLSCSFQLINSVNYVCMLYYVACRWFTLFRSLLLVLLLLVHMLTCECVRVRLLVHLPFLFHSIDLSSFIILYISTKMCTLYRACTLLKRIKSNVYVVDLYDKWR